MLGENIRKIRNEKGLTQNDVVLKAKELKKDSNKETFNQSQLSKWEKNETTPSKENIELLEQIYECSLSQLPQEEMRENDSMTIYKEGFDIGCKFERKELKKTMYILSDSKREYKDKIEYLISFLIRNDIKVPEFFIEMLSLCENNNESGLLPMFYMFIIGLWNGRRK